MIDNYDSFTWNVYQYLCLLGADVTVYRNDQISVQKCIDLKPTHVVISPGPGTPNDTGIARDVIKAFAGKKPILGVCMGEQCMIDLYGGVVEYAGEIMHGKASCITNDGKGLYKGLPSSFDVIRYHSLAGTLSKIPECLTVTSSTSNGIVMGVRHKEYVMEGVQYHPESIKSENGMAFETKKFDLGLIEEALDDIFSGNATDAQIAAFLVLIKCIGETPELISCCVDIVRKNAKPCAISGCVDIVGTGGDGHSTFNVSSCSSVVVAGAGVKVAKHGNRSSSSPCGSADILEKLGGKLDMTPEQNEECIKRSGYTFLFAQSYHPKFRHVGPVRKQVGLPTIFNIIGPLSNPATPDYMVVGCYHKSLGRLIIETLKLQGLKGAMVVCGCENLDELSIAGKSDVWIYKDGRVTETQLHPGDFGLPTHSLELVKGGGKEENEKIFRGILAGEEGPNTDFVLLNSAALLYVCGKASNFREGVKLARESISSGAAAEVLRKYCEYSVTLAK
eukprot:Nk52_evm55s221 gene=Nk52_evmTU55s221